MSNIPKRDPQSLFTDNQWQAIHEDGHNLLLSASAGSGKTSVLVQRIIAKIKKGVSIKRLLVVTFTERAAGEMKERLEKELRNLVNQTSDTGKQRFYIQQIQSLPEADISTIDAFCRQVILRFYYLIDLDPVYRLLTDKTEISLQRQKVWQQLKEEWLAVGDEDYLIIHNNFSNGQSDKAVDDLVYSLYDKARVHANPKQWLEELLHLYDDNETFGDSQLFQDYIQPMVLSEIERLKNRLFQLKQQLPIAEVDSFKKLSDDIDSIIERFNQIKQLLQVSYQQAFDLAHSKLPIKTSVSKKGLTNEEEDIYKEYADRFKAIKDDFTKKIVPKYLAFNDATQTQFHHEAYQIAKATIQVLIRFLSKMEEQKRKDAVMDFSDIEGYTYQILTSPSKNQAGETVSEAKIYYQSLFEEILIDEYQDVNALQEAILTTISRGNNMFMVGDVKQSIYRFRFAEPQLFIQKFEDYADGENGNRIILAENFRSRNNVLQFTNYIFRQIMDKTVGQITYDDTAALVNGFKDFKGETNQFNTEVLMYESTSEDDDNRYSEKGERDSSSSNFTGDEGEITLMAQKIKQMIQHKFKIYDKTLKQMRPITYRDIVILASSRTRYLDIEKVFETYHIPLHLDKSTNYFQRIEMLVMLNVLRLVDNPDQDIPLASVLRSPILNLSEPELANIRLANQNGSYYQAFLAYLEQADLEDNLAKKLKQFDYWLENWRNMARDHAISELIWQIYLDTGFLTYVSGMPNGEQRQRNLHGLYQRAVNFENTGFKGLFQFIQFVEAILSQDNDLETPQVIDEDMNNVSVMTVHASKGLEFPVVFYLNFTQKFNTEDVKQPYIASDAIGLGVEINNLSKQVSYQDPLFQLAKIEEKQQLLAEEMRKLYVALTRAEQKLILVGKVKDWDKAVTVWGNMVSEDELIPSTNRLNAQSLADWIMPAILRHKNSQNVNHVLDIPILPSKELTNLLKIEVVNEESLSKRHNTSTVESEVDNDINLQMLDIDIDNLPDVNWKYAYRQAIKTTSYQSVSELKRLMQDPDEEELTPFQIQKQNSMRYTSDTFEEPQFIQEAIKVATPQAIGTATHLLMQRVPLDTMPTTDSLRNLFTQLAKKGVVNQKLETAIDFDNLAAFFATDMGQLLLREHHDLYREESFSLMLPANEIFDETGLEDRLLVHGTIDGFILKSDHIILYDFKTDRLNYLNPGQQEKTLRERYETQISLYAKALEAIWGRPVTKKVLISLDTVKNFYI